MIALHAWFVPCLEAVRSGRPGLRLMALVLLGLAFGLGLMLLVFALYGRLFVTAAVSCSRRSCYVE